jgi:TolB-like protein
VGQVRSHKRGAIISLALLLVVGAIAVVYGWRLKQAPASTEKEIKSLAVMPLESVNPDENHLGLGIADAVILRISQTGKLVVRPTSAGRRYLSEDTDGLTAAKQLGVDSVLEGTVQRANNRLRVNVNLLRTSDGISLWSDSFNLNAGDIFAIQDTISQQVASRLQLKLDAEQQARLGKRYTNGFTVADCNRKAFEVSTTFYVVLVRLLIINRLIILSIQFVGLYDHLGLDEAAGLRESQRALEIDPTNTRLQARLVGLRARA